MTHSPKVIINDDFIDLRSASTYSKEKLLPENKRQNKHPSLVNEGIKQEKELLMKDLVQNYFPIPVLSRALHNRKKKDLTTHDPRFRKSVKPPENSKFHNSHSELSIVLNKVDYHPTSPSSPQIIKRITGHQKSNTLVDLTPGTENHADKDVEKRSCVSISQQVTDPKTSTSKCIRETKTRDPRLLRKYSVLNMPWKRTWTLPVIAKKSNAFPDPFESIDRQTYKYDDGTEIDSLFVPPKPITLKKISGLQTKTMMSLFLLGSTCGLLFVSLVIWIIFGNETVKHLIKPKREPSLLLKLLKAISGSIVQLFASTINFIGRILTMPTHEVYQPHQETNHRLWPF